MANPLLKDDVFSAPITAETMTVSGVINKSIILWFLLLQARCIRGLTRRS
jgi:hypothetical protein